MKKVIFITTRNIINTSGELRLIKNRGVALYNNFGIETEYFALTSKKRLNKKREGMGNGSKLNIYSFTNYFSFIVQAKKLARDVACKIETEESIIIISGFVPLLLFNKLKNLRVKKYIDIHGTLQELREYSQPSMEGKLKNSLKYLLFSRAEKKAASICNGIIVVSNALKEYYTQILGIGTENFFVVPCGGNAESLDLEEYYINRTFWRKALDIDDKYLLFIYSGGSSPWQSLEQMVDLYSTIKGNINKKSKLLIMSGDLSALEKYKRLDKDIVVKSFNAEQVGEVLCAGDVALLLRDDTITNNVAFPNKYYEYLLSGMYIICSQYIKDQASLTVDYAIGTIYAEGLEQELLLKLNQIADIEQRKPDIDRLLKKLSFKNTLQDLMRDLSK